MKQIPGHFMYSATEDGRIYSHYKNRFIRLTVNDKKAYGHLKVGLLISSNPKKYKYYYVHRLIMLTYIGPCPEGLQVDHKDKDTANNNLYNLHYVTPKDNCKNRIHSNQFIKERNTYGI